MSVALNHGSAAPRRSMNPPPVCFNCNEEGHFVVNCPKTSRVNTSVFPVQPVQQTQIPNVQPYYPQPGPPPPQYHPPQHTQYAVHHQAPNYGYSPSQPYGQAPMPQNYIAPPVAGQYRGPNFQPPHNHFLQQSPQYGPSPFQHPAQGFAYPVNATFQSPAPSYAPQNSVSPQSYGPSQASHPTPTPWSPTSQPHPQPPRSAPPYHHQQRSMSQVTQIGQASYMGASTQDSGQQIARKPVQKSVSQGYTARNPASTRNNPPIQNQFSHSSIGSVSNQANIYHSSSARPRSQSQVSTMDKDVKQDEHAQETVPRLLAGNSENTPEPDTDNQQFKWDFQKIFMEPSTVECVALAQPLATSYEVTPVPQIDIKSKKSVSRLARNDNQKEYTASIRSAPHWSFAQEDPIFAELDLNSPLIPIDQVPAWIARRQGLPEVAGHAVPNEEISRKRARPSDSEELMSDSFEGEGQKIYESHLNKRPKNQPDSESDSLMVEITIPHNGDMIPVLARDRTPCVGIIDDAWAPEPGEIGSISSPADPTEALLASLGVTGDAKPVPKDSGNSSVLAGPEESTLQDEHIKAQQKQDTDSSISHPEHSDMEEQSTHISTPHSAASAATPHSLPHKGSYNRWPPSYSHFPGSEPHRSASWSSGHQQHQYHHQTGGVSVDFNYQNGHVGIPSHYSPQQGHPVQNPQRSSSFPNAHSSQSQYSNSTSPNGSYGFQTNSPQNSQYHHGRPPQSQYPGSAYPHPQYHGPPSQPTPQWINGAPPISNGSFGPPTAQGYGVAVPGTHQYHGMPNQYENQLSGYGPNQPQSSASGQHNSYPPQGYSQYDNTSANRPLINHQQPDVQQSTIHQSRQPYQAPNRQDSGYMSARGSYSNDSGETGDSTSCTEKAVDLYPAPNKESDKPQSDQSQPRNQEDEGVCDDNHSDAESDPGTPLSPTSAEILGKLVQQPKKRKASNALNGDRRVKRPQPVVAEAYSRRW